MISGKAFDVAIIGGGVIGLAAAREIAAHGMSVVVLERNERVGAEASHAAGGMLAPQAEADANDDFFQLCAASRDLYPRFAAELLEETGIDIEFDRTGMLYVALNEDDETEIEGRYKWQKRAGLEVERLSAMDARRLEPNLSRAIRLALRFPKDTQVEPRRLTAALEKSCELRGVRILTSANVLSLKVENRRVLGAETSQDFVSSNAVVIAGGAWSSQIKIQNFTMPQIEPVRGQMLCFDARAVEQANEPVLRHIAYSPRGYLIPRRDGRLLAGSTCEFVGFDKSVTAEGRRAIQMNAREIVPRVAALKLTDSWAGLRPRAADALPIIGRASNELENLYLALGHFRNGILLAPATADALAASILGKSSPLFAMPFMPNLSAHGRALAQVLKTFGLHLF